MRTLLFGVSRQEDDGSPEVTDIHPSSLIGDCNVIWLFVCFFSFVA